MSRVQLFFIGLMGTLYFWAPLHANPLAFYGAHIAIPQGWTEVDQPTPNERYFLNEDKSATLNIAYYQAEELSSVNALAQHRIVSRFEGWITMLDRPAKPEELKRVNANDGRITVYNRQLMLGPNKISEDIVGEYYYFVSPNIGYVVSIETAMAYWKAQQPTFRSIIDSFGIGHIPDPIQRATPVAQTPSTWTTDLFGRSREGSPDNFNPETRIKQQYKINLGTADIGQPQSWALSGDNLYIQFEKHLACVDTLSKKMLWIFQVPGSPRSPIWAHRGALYMVRHTLDGDAFLFAIQSDSGGVIFSENLGSHISFAVGSGKNISLIKSGKAVTFDIDSRMTETHDSDTDHIFSFKQDILMTKNKTIFSKTDSPWELGGTPLYILGETDTRYVVLHTEGEAALEAISLKRKRTLWHTKLGHYQLTQPPILHGETLLAFVTDRKKNHHHVLRFDSRTGQLLQQETLPGPVDANIPFGNGVYIHFQNTNAPYTGWIPWETFDLRILKDTNTWTDVVVTPHGKWMLSVDKDALIMTEVNYR